MPLQPTVSVNPVPLCQNSVPSPLTATASGTLNWYLTPTGGTALPTLTPQTANTGLTAYYVSQTDVNGCESARTQVSVNVKPRPTVPIVGSNAVTLCQNSPPMALTALSIGTQNWYTVPVDGIPTPSVTPQTTTPGTVSYYVSQTVDGCESARIPVVVTIQPTPGLPAIGANPIFCQGGTTTPLSASPTSGGSLNWYTTATGGTASPTAPAPPSTAAGLVTYYVSQSVNGCEGPRAILTATIKTPPTAPFVPALVTYCQGAIATSLTATLAGGVSLNWYTTPVGGAASSALTPTTNAPGSIIYYVSQTDANGCESIRAPVTVRVNALPAAPAVSPVSFCQGSLPTPISVLPTGGTINYYQTPTGGVASPVGPTPNTASPATTPYYVSQTDVNGCESTRSILLVTVAPTPAAPSVPLITPVCQNSPAVILTAAGTNLKWYADAVSNAVAPAVQQTTLAGTFYYYVSQTVNTCESPRTQVAVVVNALPAVPGVTLNQSGCQDALVQPLTAIGTGLQWYDQNDNLISPPIPNTRVDVVQIYSYKVTQTINGCTSPKATIQYTVNVTPAPTVMSSVSFCQNSAPTPLQATGTNLKWYDPTGAITASAPSPPTVVASSGTSYSVSQTSSLGCESRKAEIRVIINALPTANLEGTTVIYLGGSPTLTLTASGGGPYSYSLSEGTTGTIESSASSPTTVRSVTVTPGATTTYTLSSIANACGKGIATGTAVVTVLVPTIATAPLATTSASTSICSGASLTVPFSTTGNFVAGNSFTLEIASAIGDTTKYIPISNAVVPGPGGASISTSIPPTVAAGQYFVRVSAANGRYPIYGARSPTILTVKPKPTAAISVTKRTIYAGESVVLNLTFTGDPSWAGNYLAGAINNPFSSTASIYSTTITPSTTTTYKLVNILNTVCGPGAIEGADTVTVQVGILLAEKDPLSNSVTVYPVPTDGAVTVAIDLPLQSQPAQLRLVGSDGRITQEVTTRMPQTVLDLNNEPAGIYLLRITVGDRSTVRKILKR